MEQYKGKCVIGAAHVTILPRFICDKVMEDNNGK